jgi:hypothetical protein
MFQFLCEFINPKLKHPLLPILTPQKPIGPLHLIPQLLALPLLALGDLLLLGELNFEPVEVLDELGDHVVVSLDLVLVGLEFLVEGFDF